MDEAVHHLSDLELDAFLNRAASVPGLAGAGKHLAECPQCQARAEERAGIGDGVAALYRQVAQSLPEEHLSEEDVQVLAKGGLLPNPASRLYAHLDRCDSCRAEVDDLKQFIASRRRPQSFRAQYWIPIAALLLAAISILAWRSMHNAPHLPAEYAALVERVRSTNQLEVAPAVAALGRGRLEQLLGEPEKAPGFALISPLKEATMSDRPTFSWSSLPGASSYRVDIYDENFGKAAESPDVTATSWTPAQSLDSSHTYSWTVTARIGKQEIRQPVPPAPEARFKVLAPAEAAQLRDAAQKYPNDHLLLAALYARAGAIEEARRELNALQADGPSSDLARRLAASLDGLQ